MTEKMGMDSELYKERSLEIGNGIHELCGDLYAAIDDDVSLDEVNDLLAAGEKKIALFESLLEATSGGMREGLHKGYIDEIETIKNFSAQLKEKYHD